MIQVADGMAKFTAGCWLRQGRGRFVLGTMTGEVEVYDEKNLSNTLDVASHPQELEIVDGTEVTLGLREGG